MDAYLLEELYRKYHRGALLYCTALCSDPYLAQDIAAEAFVKAYLTSTVLKKPKTVKKPWR